RRAASSRLLKVAEPLMSSLYEIVAGSGYVIVLVDADGYVLSATGDPGVLESARSVNFVPGVRWTEKLVGTTAIGIALASKYQAAIVDRRDVPRRAGQAPSRASGAAHHQGGRGCRAAG
ncbi:MAG: hypothetical protein AB1563_10655, partial [Bacillota bacterium]